MRQALSKKLRFEILKRDEFRCRYCGRTEADGVKLHVDHVIAVALGGRNDLENLATACADCNLGKSAAMLNDPRVIGVDFEERKKIFDTAHESICRYREYLKAKDIWEYALVSELISPFKEIFAMPWAALDAESLTWNFDRDAVLPMEDLPPNMQTDLIHMVVSGYARNAEARVSRSVLHFFKNLGPEVVLDAAKIAAIKATSDWEGCPDDAFRYFCGICHKRIAKAEGRDAD